MTDGTTWPVLAIAGYVAMCGGAGIAILGIVADVVGNERLGITLVIRACPILLIALCLLLMGGIGWWGVGILVAFALSAVLMRPRGNQ